MRYASQKTQIGFTLLEVLVSVAIFALISLASFSLFDGVLKSEAVSKAQMTRLNEVQRAWMIIERDILQIAHRSMRIEGEAADKNFIRTSFDGYASSDNALAFVRYGWTNPGLLIPRSDMQSVAYRLDDKQLQRLHFNFVDSVVGEEPKIRPLISGVERISFEFYYQKKWQKTIEEGRLPLAISIILDTEDLGVLTRKFLVAGESEATQTETRRL
ncbi:type II secretion system minor pseudopilin GspJ [Thalassotalea piscium]|uniref:Type II secretion system protein J n=1 Tax=Thalassotalea piscium TaxID=1230533 RepID=A0A7X0NHC3_9GAMM|nr:type II secretion system minor pseudopilin GspJ [Thalassotalea piscium]MBB6543475.1 general secretion pathway protein J [Thalassotalea piscium]